MNSHAVLQVTGSNKGIGAEVARQLAAQGLTPVVTGRSEESAKAAAAAIGAEVGREVPFHQLDITDPQSVSRFADFIKRRFGGVDIVVNNAAIAFKVGPGYRAALLRRRPIVFPPWARAGKHLRTR